MKKLINVLIVFMMFTVLLVGCSKDSKNEAKENNSSKKDEITVAWSSDLDNFGPLTSEDGFSHEILGLVYEPLMKFDGKKAIPNLAEKFEISKDKKEYTFHLRKNVKFSDGVAFNAEAVKKNMDGILKNADRFSWMGAIGKLDKVKVIDEFTIKFIYKEPYYAALLDMCSQFPIRMISPSSIPDSKNTAETLKSSVGTGPYVLTKSIKNQEYIFELNKNYWGEKPKFKKVTVKIIPDHDSRVMALKSGDVDLIYGAKQLSYEAYSQFKNNDKIGIACSKNESETRSILMNTTNKILSDINVRKAILQGINKEDIISNALLGIEEKANSILNPKLPYCNVSIKPYKYNKKKASEILNNAGWVLKDGKTIREKNGKPLSLKLMYVNSRGAEGSIAQMVAAQMKEIGIDIKLESVELMDWGSRGFEGKFDLAFNSTYAAPYDPHNYIGGMMSYSLDNPAQKGLQNKKDLDSKISQLFSTNDENKIQECYDYILNNLHDSGMYIPISYQKQIALYNKDVISKVEFPNIPGELDMLLIK
ncbi:nickel ABC transporter substrate-binding protein [Clostridium oceanicum]|uniref:Nickel ABC transporter substrate-binding protein n=1 Tax=Clostridium oceanicum TaxID=1543 RepID=A0ABN1J9G2_9CLOT